MSWYDELGELIIELLKENTTPFGLRTEWEKDRFREIFKEEPASLQVYFGATNNWGTMDSDDLYLEGDRTYRLNPDWTRPEKAEKKEGHWEYCEVYIDAGTYRFTRSDGVDFLLHFALNVPGFGGIEFAERPDIWCCGLMLGVEGAKADVKDARPATPKRVRFWVE
jgi:hypothetical protein